MQNSSFTLKVAGLVSNDYAFKNCLFLNTKDFNGIKLLSKSNSEEIYIKIREFTFQVKEVSAVQQGKHKII